MPPFPLPLPVAVSQKSNIATPTPTAPTINSVTISGTGRIGDEHTASVSVSGYPSPAFAWQWRRNGAAISGATGQTYSPVAADDGTNLTVTVTATNSEGSDSDTSAPVAVTYSAPTASGGLADQTWTESTGVQTYDVSGDFTNATGGAWSLPTAPSGVTISAAGVVSVDTDATGALADATIIVRYLNSGGSADSGFGLTVEESVSPGAPTVDAFLRDDEMFDDGAARAIGYAEVPVSGTGAPGLTIEARGVSQGDIGDTSSGWQTVGTVDGSGDYEGTINLLTNHRAYAVEVRHASNPNETETTTNACKIGTLGAIYGQSEIARAFNNSAAMDPLTPPALLSRLDAVALIPENREMAGRHSNRLMSTAGVDPDPAGMSVGGSVVTISGSGSAGAPLLFEDWNFDGFRVVVEGDHVSFRNCRFGESAAPLSGLYDFAFVRGDFITFEHCDFISFAGEGGVAAAIRQELVGTDETATSTNGLTIRRCRFENMPKDSLKLSGANVRVELNYFGKPVNISQPLNTIPLWDSGTTYALDAYALNAAGYVFRSLIPDNTGNTIPAGFSSDANWQSLLELYHCDHITVEARLGPIWVRWNFFEIDIATSDSAIGMNNALRCMRNTGQTQPWDGLVIFEGNILPSSSNSGYPLQISNGGEYTDAQDTVRVRFNRLGGAQNGGYIHTNFDGARVTWTGNVDFDTGDPIAPPAAETTVGTETETSDGHTQVAYNPVSPGYHVVTDTDPRTTSFAAMANAWLGWAPDRPFRLAIHAVSGTHPAQLADDAYVPSTPRGWADDAALNALARPYGQRVGFLTASWFAGPRNWGNNYGANWFAFLTGRDLATGTSIAAGSTINGAFDLDHNLGDLYDFAHTLFIPQGPHRFDTNTDMFSATEEGDGVPGSQGYAMLAIENCRKSYRAMAANENAAAYMSPIALEAVNYSNGLSDGADSTHPTVDSHDGLPRSMELLTIGILRGMGAINIDPPEINAAAWQANGSYMEMWDSRQDLRTVRIARGDTPLGTTYDHWTDVFAVQIDGSPAHRAEIVSGRVRVYPISGVFTSASVITFGEGGAGGQMEFPEDFANEAWKNSLIGQPVWPMEGLSAAPLPSAAVLATTVPSDVTAPAFSSSTPADGATGVAVISTITVTFDEALVAGTGTFTLRDVTGSADAEVFTVGGSGSGGGTISVSGPSVILTPGATMSGSNAYAVRWTAGAVEDAAGNGVAANSTDTLLNFTTAAAGPPTFKIVATDTRWQRPTAFGSGVTGFTFEARMSMDASATNRIVCSGTGGALQLGIVPNSGLIRVTVRDGANTFNLNSASFSTSAPSVGTMFTVRISIDHVAEEAYLQINGGSVETLAFAAASSGSVSNARFPAFGDYNGSVTMNGEFEYFRFWASVGSGGAAPGGSPDWEVAGDAATVNAIAGKAGSPAVAP